MGQDTAGGVVSGRAGGTISYMGPEFFLERNITSAVDVWALGVLLYLLLSGSLPYTADTRKTAWLHASLAWHPVCYNQCLLTCTVCTAKRQPAVVSVMFLPSSAVCCMLADLAHSRAMGLHCQIVLVSHAASKPQVKPHMKLGQCLTCLSQHRMDTFPARSD